jgi:carbonic anhydrase/acetyltransferase-like protein (isoleucine patch superfamily)
MPARRLTQRAWRRPSGRALAPCGDAAASLMVFDGTLRSAQDAACAAAGFAVVDGPAAPDGPHLVFDDDVWFTAEALRRLCDGGAPGRLCVDDDDFLLATWPLQEGPARGVFALGWSDGRPLEALPVRAVGLGLRTFDPGPVPAALAHAARPVRIGPAMVHAVHHWSHLLRVNQLALAARGEEARVAWEAAGPLGKAARALRVLAAARGVGEAAILRALNVVGPGCRIHPQAVVEASVLGPGVEVGAHAVVRGSVLGAGARVEEHATVALSVLGARVRVGRYGHLQGCTAMDGAFVSAGDGFQLSVFGRDCFVAWGVSILDLSLGGPVRVDDPPRDSGHHLLGVAVGHGAVLGNGVRVNHGVAIPNGACIVGDAHALLRDPRLPATPGPARVVDGALQAVPRRGGAT